MDGSEQAEATLDALNGPEVNGRALTVNGVLPREERGGSRQPQPLDRLTAARYREIA
jgi:hypothetical protein